MAAPDLTKTLVKLLKPVSIVYPRGLLAGHS